MIFIAISLALFVIYAGTRLLIQTKLEAPGRFQRFVAWFLIVMGFLMIAGSGTVFLTRFCGAAGYCMTDACDHACCRNACGAHQSHHGAHGHAKWHKGAHKMSHQGGMHGHACCEGDNEMPDGQ